jgi:hypothetical protein
MSEKITKRSQGYLTLGLSAIFLFVVAATIGLFFAQPTEGAMADQGYRFNSSSVAVGDCTRNYGFEISSAVANYNDSTDLTMTYIGHACTTITYTQGDYGVTPWIAITIARNSSGDPCADFSNGFMTGNCNKTNKKAAAATIYFNDHYALSASSSFSVRHEMGHVFGMAHVTGCTPLSVMKVPGECSEPFPPLLTTADINLINSWY